MNQGLTHELDAELDFLAEFKWTIEDLVCTDCGHRDKGFWSPQLTPEHQAGHLLRCGICGSRNRVLSSNN